MSEEQIVPTDHLEPRKTIDIPMGEDSDSAVEIASGEATILKGGEAKTYNASPCVVVALRDDTTEVGALMHLHSFTNIPLAMEQVVEGMKAAGATKEQIHAFVIGGAYVASDEIVAGTRDALATNSIPIVGEDTLNVTPERPSISVLFNNETGQLRYISPPSDVLAKRSQSPAWQTRRAAIMQTRGIVIVPSVPPAPSA